ncbi:Holliday junction resolvase RecU [Candidatus Phytoplasma sacchari]|nr:Holliday junction resolvase RecU [Candidatus Phytoplasma sacchari]KAB8122865.1 Holliday junction resolvase RecU [Candidatus Phytoplasma sacchari]
MKYPFKKNFIKNKIEKNSNFLNINFKKNYFKKNLGLTLEKDINLTNNFYKEKNIALIYKNEIPIKITKVEYPKRQKAKIVQAYFHSNSLPDYHGLYKGNFLSFDVKETSNKTSFSLNNIPMHQINNLKKIHHFKGISFFIIYFKNKNKYFYLPIEFLINYLKKCNLKSINYKIFEKELFQIPFSYLPRIDYLKIVDKFIK